jgi:murein DD-endopeptidase MepM/ murein hydrolase activator NlpD
MRRRLQVLLISSALLVASFPAMPAGAEMGADGIYRMVFPVDGEYRLTQSFGDPRDGGARSHEGEDIMVDGVKGLPVVAAESGTVGWMQN